MMMLIPELLIVVKLFGECGCLDNECCCVQGVVHTYGSLQAQIVGMEDRWGWTRNDVLLHVLPLHHVHGNVNCLMTPMWCGACCIMMPSFDAEQVQ